MHTSGMPKAELRTDVFDLEEVHSYVYLGQEV